LTADDLPEPESLPSPSWADRKALKKGRLSDQWGFGLAVKRQVLEAHFGFGRLAVAGRHPNFQRVYDLAERVIPSKYRRRRFERGEAQRELLLRAARALGVATVGDLADYYRMSSREARAAIAELAGAGRLRPVRVEGWRESAYLHPKARLSQPIDRAALLSPFDPLIWTRPRVMRLFDFDYRLEIFAPQRKRRWGYYVLPFLLGDRLVARADLKADRGARRLLVLAAYLERHVKPDEAATPLAVELEMLAAWLGLERAAVRRGSAFEKRLAAAVHG
jgi:hypothetical protein